MSRDLAREIAYLVDEVHPRALDGDMREHGRACSAVTDVLGSLLAFIMAMQGREAYEEARRFVAEKLDLAAEDTVKRAAALRSRPAGALSLLN